MSYSKLQDAVRRHGLVRVAADAGVNESTLRSILKRRSPGSPETWKKLAPVLGGDVAPPPRPIKATATGSREALLAGLAATEAALARPGLRSMDRIGLLRELNGHARALERGRPLLLIEFCGYLPEGRAFFAEMLAERPDALAKVLDIVDEVERAEAAELEKLGPDPYGIYAEVIDLADALLAEELSDIDRVRALSVRRVAATACARLDSSNDESARPRCEALSARLAPIITDDRAILDFVIEKFEARGLWEEEAAPK